MHSLHQAHHHRPLAASDARVFCATCGNRPASCSCNVIRLRRLASVTDLFPRDPAPLGGASVAA